MTHTQIIQLKTGKKYLQITIYIPLCTSTESDTKVINNLQKHKINIV